MSATSTPTHTPPKEDETLFQHIGRATKNFFTGCMGCISTSDEKAKIKYKEYQIENRKKKFGVDYMNLKLKEGGSTDDELKACIDTCLEDLEKLNKEIADLEAEIDRVNTATEAKIIKKPGAEGAATGTAAASATAAAPETPAPAAEATATAST